MAQETQKYVVREKIVEATDVSTISLSFVDGTVPKFTAGQYITVYLPETKTPEGKAYSISNAPGKETIALTVKAIGEFSNRLCSAKAGDTITASLPYGYFTNEDGNDDCTLVLLAAGIGIAPFRSIIQDIIEHKPEKKIVLFHSSKTLAEMIFKKEFDDLQKSTKNFKANYFVTREKNVQAKIIAHRMTAEDILDRCGSSKNLEFMLCGNISFNRDLWRALRAAGIQEDLIATEAFF